MKSLENRTYDILRSKPNISKEELEKQLIEEGYILEGKYGYLNTILEDYYKYYK